MGRRPGFAPNRSSFVLSLRVELASIGFKKPFSPFRNPKFVEVSTSEVVSSAVRGWREAGYRPVIPSGTPEVCVQLWQLRR